MKFEKDKQYKIELKDNSIIENFYVYENTELYLLGCIKSSCIEKIKMKNKGEDVICRGEFLLLSDIKKSEELFQNIKKS